MYLIDKDKLLYRMLEDPTLRFAIDKRFVKHPKTEQEKKVLSLYNQGKLPLYEIAKKLGIVDHNGIVDEEQARIILLSAQLKTFSRTAVALGKRRELLSTRDIERALGGKGFDDWNRAFILSEFAPTGIEAPYTSKEISDFYDNAKKYGIAVQPIDSVRERFINKFMFLVKDIGQFDKLPVTGRRQPAQIIHH